MFSSRLYVAKRISTSLRPTSIPRIKLIIAVTTTATTMLVVFDMPFDMPVAFPGLSAGPGGKRHGAVGWRGDGKINEIPGCGETPHPYRYDKAAWDGAHTKRTHTLPCPALFC